MLILLVFILSIVVDTYISVRMRYNNANPSTIFMVGQMTAIIQTCIVMYLLLAIYFPICTGN